MTKPFCLWRVFAIAAVAFSVVFAMAPSASASGLNLGTDANYAVVDLGHSTTFGWNSGPVNGSVLVGNGVTLSTSGGNNGGLGSGYKLYYDGSTICSPSPCGSGLQTPPSTSSVTGPGAGTVTGNALSIAQSVSSYAAGLTANQTYNNLSGTPTILASGAQTVVDLTGTVNNPTLTISGNASDIFVFNVTGNMQENQLITLSGGLTANHVLWNLTGTSGNCLQTSGGNSMVGTFLATNGCGFQFSNLRLVGELINTAGNVQLVSGSQVNTTSGFTTVPEPSTLALLGICLVGLGIDLVRRKRHGQGLPLVF